MELSYCQVCSQRKHPDEFSAKNVGRKCRDCAWMKQVELRYRMTRSAYDELLARQGGSCAVCHGDGGGRRFEIDHDHKCCPSQKTCGSCVRGILCHACNTKVGMVEAGRGASVRDPLILMDINGYLYYPYQPTG